MTFFWNQHPICSSNHPLINIDINSQNQGRTQPRSLVYPVTLRISPKITSVYGSDALRGNDEPKFREVITDHILADLHPCKINKLIK